MYNATKGWGDKRVNVGISVHGETPGAHSFAKKMHFKCYFLDFFVHFFAVFTPLTPWAFASSVPHPS